MFNTIRKNKGLLAFGSVMEVLPTGDYSEHMPAGRGRDRLGKYWQTTSKYLSEAMERQEHERTAKAD